MRATPIAFGVVVGTVLAALLAATPGRAEEARSISSEGPPGIETMTFYTGNGQIGVFPGTLVCLRCEMARTPEGMEECVKRGHRHALLMEDGSMVHPLLVGTEDAQKKVNSSELHGKRVKVSGKYYPSTGFIFVSEIVPAS